MDDDEVVSRYGYLLQPIRDLQKNFEVNLVDILDEFMEKLKLAEANSTLNVTQGRKFDFNVAGVLVRGSTVVYGKKVELVLTESRNYLEKMGSCKANASKKSMGKKGDGEAGEDENPAEAARKRDPLHLVTLTELCKRAKHPSTLVMKEHIPFQPELTATVPLCLQPLVSVEKTPFTLKAVDGKTEIGKIEDFFVNRLKVIDGALYHTTDNLQWTNVISDPNPTVDLIDSDYDALNYDDDNGNNEAGCAGMIIKQERLSNENVHEEGDSRRESPNDDFHHNPIDVDAYLPGYDPIDASTRSAVPAAAANAAGDNSYLGHEAARRSAATIPARNSEIPHRPSTRLQMIKDIKLERPDSALSFSASVIATNKEGEPLPPNKRRGAKLKKNEKQEKVWSNLEMDLDTDPFADKLDDLFEESPYKRRPYKEIRKPVSAEYLVNKKKQQSRNATESEQICSTLKFINEQVYMHGKSIRVNQDLLDDWQSNCLQLWILAADRFIKTKEREEKKRREQRGQISFMEDRAFVDDLREAVLGMKFDFSDSNLPREKIESIQEKFRLIGEAQWERFVSEGPRRKTLMQARGSGGDILEGIPEDDELMLEGEMNEEEEQNKENEEQSEEGRKKSSVERRSSARRKSTLMSNREVENRLIQGADDFEDDEEYDALVDDPVSAMNAIEDVGERFADVDDVELNEVELPNYLNYTLSALGDDLDIPDYGSGPGDVRNSSIDAERVKSVAEIMRGFTKEFYEKRDVQTGELANKVRLWEAKIGPELEQEALRPEYRVHDYGKRILDELKEDVEKNEKKPFGEFVAGKPQFEHGRFLLASLLLTNQKFVQLIKERGDDEGGIGVETQRRKNNRRPEHRRQDIEGEADTGNEVTLEIYLKDLHKQGTREIVFEE